MKHKERFLFIWFNMRKKEKETSALAKYKYLRMYVHTHNMFVFWPTYFLYVKTYAHMHKYTQKKQIW